MTSTAHAAAPDTAQRRAAVIGGAFGFFVDMFDVYLPTIALTPALPYFVPASVPSGTRAIITAAVFVSTLIGRPLGSLIFGRLADRVGRRRVTLLSVAGCAATTGVIAVLPGHAQLGLWAVALMILLRFVDGIFLGGEYTGAIPLAMEIAPPGRRGLYGSLVSIGFPLSYCAISLLSYAMLHIAPAGGPTSAYAEWGWRVPFAAGAVIGVVFLLYYSRTVRESEVWLASARRAKRADPVKTVLFGSARRSFWQVFVLMAGVWFASNMASGLLPSLLGTQTTLTATEVTGVLVVAQFVHTLCFPLIGALTDRIGRRTFFIACGLSVGVVCAAAFAFLASWPRSGPWSGVPLVFVLTLLIRISGASMFAVTPSYICERFPAAVRGSGFGMGYSLPLLVTAGYAYYQDWLGHLIPYEDTPVVLLVLGGVLILVGALIGPETRDADFETAAGPANVSATARSGRLNR
ncbi:MFS transporter [Actinomadura sp. DC4]|uniref:MFS transporter n=1 Tax=Actinomadura sp. DC4 TaxID=3055069 RepID=UPI0025AF6348|nr:MFS transporter [Actinomadura sp. DC4]MDN3359133.1 MFS transporter [Actinomadura sp. DC4]